MRLTRVIGAVLLTIAMLYIARNTSRGRPETMILTDTVYTFETVTVPKITAFQSDTLRVVVSPPPTEPCRIVYMTTGPDRGAETPLSEYEARATVILDSAAGLYGVEVAAHARGGREYYVFAVVDSSGAMVAKLTDSNGAPLFVKYIGEVPDLILIPHIVLMFVTVYCVTIAALHALGLVRGGRDVHPMAWWIFVGTTAAVIGGYPFGFGMNWYAFGTVWEGVPFGTDATDNKTQLLVVYFLFVMLSSLGSLTRGRCGHDLFGPRTLGFLGVSAFVLMLAIYLIPHSIQFSKALTYTVCYGFIGLVALTYGAALVRSRSQSPVV